MSIHDVTRTLEMFMKEIGPEVQAVTMQAFLYVAEKGSCLQTDVEADLKISNSSSSRNVSFWTERRFDRQPGMGFIDRIPDDENRRLRRLTLTAKGKKFYAKIRQVTG